MSEQENQPIQRLKFSWSNWGFGMEKLESSLSRLKAAGIDYIELHGNHYGPDLGYRINETQELLEHYNIKVSGVCGMFSKDNDLSSNRPVARQRAIDYIKRELEFTQAIGGSYLLVVPGAVGRPERYDNMELERSVETLRSLADLFQKHNVRGAIEPVRSAEVSFNHTVEDSLEYIEAVNHPAINHINGDIYHMQSEEKHIGQAILDAGEHLCNLHLADSNRGALGNGAIDIDTIIMALYILRYNEKSNFVTPEPLGPGGDPYPAMHAKPDVVKLNHLVHQTVQYFREREEQVLALI
jgi:sugar phosphate isomerase/epimerase